MEFVVYQDVLPGMQELGVVEVEDADGLSRLELEPGKNLKVIHVKCPASRVEPYPEASMVVDRSREEIERLLQHILHRLHIAEVLVIPVSCWREVINCVAYDLASDEAWQEMDAVSAIHQNTRNPLAVTPAEYHVLYEMVVSLFNNGSGPRHDLVITSDVAPLLIEVFHDGALSLTCDLSVSTHVEKFLG